MSINLKKKNYLKCNILQKDYKILSLILYNLQNTIIENENILLFSKSCSMKSLNELIKKINETYNKIVINIISKKEDIQNEILNDESIYSELPDIKSENKSDNIDETTDSDDNIIESEIKNSKIIKKNKTKKIISDEIIKLNSEDIVNLDLINLLKNNLNNNLKFNNFGKYNYLLELSKYNPFEQIKKQIIFLCKVVGFTSIKDILFLVFNIDDYIFDEKNTSIINLLNQVFIPLDYKISNSTKNQEIKIEKIENNHLILFNNQCSVNLNINNKNIIIKGFIKNDPLNINIRTAQISNIFLFNKKSRFEILINLIEQKYDSNLNITKEYYDKIQNIDKKFADIYLKNLTITEILILDEHKFINYLYDDFNKFIDLSKLQFIKLIKNFTKDASDNINVMYNIIRLLLLGNDENCCVASLLFNLIKDKKIIGCSDYIANIIYNKLNYIAQIRLKKSNFNIKNELDKIKGISSTDIDLKKQVILSKNMPDHIKKICLEKIDELKNANNETYKIKMYINILIQFPWPSDADDNIFKLVSMDKNKSKTFLQNIEKKLDNQIYGHIKAKSKTLQILAKLISVQGSHISPIALAGPPGVGKTKFAQSLADCLDIPFVQITLGGQNDGELLHGHGYTYSGAQPGLIIKKMVDSGSARCIMYFDELDKCVSKNGQVNEIMSILIHLTDPMTNGSFQDRFFQEITFPLNKVIFIFSFNDVSKIDKILLDRMEVIDVESYSIKEKLIISNDYVLKQLCKDIGFEYKSIIFNNEILTYIIENYTFEAGIRSLKRNIDNILLKLNIDKIYQRGIFENNIEYSIENPLFITIPLVCEYLGNDKISFKTIHSKDMIGVVNGLYATSLGSGGIVPIQLTANHLGKNSKFILKLTGNQKKIMKESILYSFTTAINLINNEAREIFFSKYPNGVHIHNPEAATPKDGPSAGVSFTLAFLSIMLGLKINREIALTGEIDLYGNVTKIGGVKYKVHGAFKAGVKTIFLPLENKEDLEKLQKDSPEIFDNEHICIFVTNVLEVAEKALIDWNTKKDFIIIK